MLSLNSMNHDFFIKKTFRLAKRAKGMTSPNPMVGALLVKNGKIISEGYHKKAGTAHAEVIAIDNAMGNATGSTLYTNLEPCCHKNKRTPPCTEKIISSGIKKVIIAMKDPNPEVSGKGIRELQEAGIEVISGVLDEKARRLNEFYIKYITTGVPFVILKVAMTLDGKIAAPDGESKWITGEKSREMVHKLRGSVDAVMTAIGTVKVDNPMLTCRIPNYQNPLRIVIDPHLETNLNAHVFSTPPDTILVTKESKMEPGKPEINEKKQILLKKGIKIIEYTGEKANLCSLMKEFGKMDIISVLIEGGSSLNSYCLENGIVDKVMFFIAPKIIGGRDSFTAVGGKSFRNLQNAYRITNTRVKRIGEDIMVEGYISK